MQVPRPFCSAAVQPVRPKGADAAVVAYLQGRYGAANVDYVQTSAVAAGVEAPYDVFAISSTPGSGSIRNKWYNSTTPIVNWEGAIADNAAGEFSITSGRPKETETDHSIEILRAHPIDRRWIFRWSDRAGYQRCE